MPFTFDDYLFAIALMIIVIAMTSIAVLLMSYTHLCRPLVRKLVREFLREDKEVFYQRVVLGEAFCSSLPLGSLVERTTQITLIIGPVIHSSLPQPAIEEVPDQFTVKLYQYRAAEKPYVKGV